MNTPMPPLSPDFKVEFAQSPADVQSVQRLRYEVFVSELGGTGALVDHVARLEMDQYDAVADHLILRDLTQPITDQVVGVYRLMTIEQALAAGAFSSDAEYDLRALRASGQNLLELSRSCLHKDYRGGSAMHVLWKALSAHVAEHKIDVLFGVASFHGSDATAHGDALNMLFAEYASDLNVRCRTPAAIANGTYDKKAALRATPSLIKAYLRLGGLVGQGAYEDKAFNTTDVCMIFETAKLNARQRAIYVS